MIKTSMEIPVCRLKEWAPLVDLDFVIATQVLENEDAAEHFRYRPEGRELILDNAFHELGYPLPLLELGEAARRVKADYVITPDKVGDVEFNQQSYHDARRTFGTEFKLAVVMTNPPNGDWADRECFLMNVRDADMLCCTFKEPRRLTFYSASGNARRWKRVHLLGVDSEQETRDWAQLAANLPDVTFSIDTGKALKWALRRKRLIDVENLRTQKDATTAGKPHELAQHILKLKEEDITPELDALLRSNVKILKDWCTSR